MEHCDNKTNQNTNGQSPDSISQCSRPGLAVYFKGDKMFRITQYSKRTGEVIRTDDYDFLADAKREMSFVQDILRTRRAVLSRLEISEFHISNH